MLDPIVVGFVLSAVAAVVAIVFYMFSGGDNFDKVFDQKKKEILAGGEKEKQSKKKTVKRKDVKDKKGDAGDKADGVEPETVEEVVKTEPVEGVSSSEEKEQIGEGKKKKNKKAKKTSESQEDVVVVPETKPETPKPSPTPATNQESSPKKSKKKEKKEKKVEEDGDNSEWIPATKKEKTKVAAPKEAEPKVVEAPVQQKAAPVVSAAPVFVAEQPREKIIEIRTVGFAPEVAKALSEAPLDLPKLLKVFATDPILTKCATVMRTYVEEKERQHAHNVEALTKTLEATKAEINRAPAGLVEQQQQIIRELTAENTDLSEKVAILQSELESVRALSESNRKRNEQMEIELKNSAAALESAQKATREAQEYQAKLKEASTLFEEASKQAHGRELQKDQELQHLKAQLEDLQSKYNAPAGMDMDYDKLMEEYLKIKALVDQLNEEVPKFEAMKQELTDKNEQFLKQEKKLVSLEESQKTLEKENADLRNQIAELSKKLATAAAAPKTNDDAGEEIVILSHASNQLAAPPSSNGSLEEENKRLQEKNDELRARNFKLMDRVKEAEGKHSDAPAKSDNAAVSSSVIAERTKAISILKVLPEAASMEAPKPNDSEAYSKWLSSLEKSCKAANKGCKKNKAPKESDSTEEAERYKNALILLADELSQIQILVDEKNESHENEVRTLKEQLKKASKH